MYICIYVYMYICIYEYMYICISISSVQFGILPGQISSFTGTTYILYTYIHMHIWVYPFVYVMYTMYAIHVYLTHVIALQSQMYTHKYVYMYICVNVYMYNHISITSVGGGKLPGRLYSRWKKTFLGLPQSAPLVIFLRSIISWDLVGDVCNLQRIGIVRTLNSKRVWVRKYGSSSRSHECILLRCFGAWDSEDLLRGDW